jgi:EAL domain-containing protein (putative c-di-GMP-specific phosphodiesterase class I)
VKIEGDFIKDIALDWRDKIFVKSIVALAKGMKMKVVAEYVENEETLKVLKEIGVDYGQGFYFGRPSPEIKG